jgi:endoglycosylceramidase
LRERAGGTPRAESQFTFTYTPNPAIRSPTIVFLPALHYPNGYRVDAAGARVVSAPGATRLKLANDPGARTVRWR